MSGPRTLGPLPEEHSTFVGRRAELASARAALGQTRLLTVIGPGGMGKTRFAARLAKTVQKLYRDSVLFFDLSTVPAGGSVVDQVATTLGLQTLGQDPARDVTGYFGDSRALLVFDGCEHVLESARDLIIRVLRDCAKVTIIATSQAMLRLSAEHVFVLDPLPVQAADGSFRTAAVQLFVDRIRDTHPEPNDDELRDIAEICRRLDGIPLAIELAATRVRTLTPSQIIERLDAPLAFLTRGDLDLPDRQRTLTSTIAWSYELCNEEERELWRLMAVFGAPWSVVAAERMAADKSFGQPVIDIVESLLERSILRRVPDGALMTYTMFDSIRRFGLEISAPDERERAMVAHRDFYVRALLRLEAQWYGPDQPFWLAFTLRALPNLRAAIQFSIDRGDADEAGLLVGLGCRVTWFAHGRVDEARRWVMQVLQMPSSPTPMRCQLMALEAVLESRQDDISTAMLRVEEAARVAQELGDPITLGAVETARGYIERDLNRKVAAFERALELHNGMNQQLSRSDIEERLADAHDRLGHTEVAATMVASLTARAAAAGDTFETSNLLANAGVNATLRGDHEKARTLLLRALELKQDLDHRFGLAIVQDALASVAAAGQDYTRAAVLLGVSQALWGHVGAGAAPFSRLAALRPEIESETRRLLGARAFEAAYRRGQKMSVDDGVDYALGRASTVRLASAAAATGSSLSGREREVAALVAEGLSDKGIAQKLSISPRTVEGHVAKCLMKLGLTSRSQLAVWNAREAAST